MSNVLTKEDILSAVDIEVIYLEIPEWNGGVWLRSFNGRDRDKFEEYISNKNNKPGSKKGKNQNIDIKGIKALAVVRSVVDAEVDGQFIFTEAEIPDINQKSAKAIGRIFDKFCEMNGLGEDDVDDLVGNSESETSDTSGSSSLET